MKIICAIILIFFFLAILVQLIKVDKECGTLNTFFWIIGAGPFFGILTYIALR